MYAVVIFIIGILMAVVGTPIAAVIGTIFEETGAGVTVWLIISVSLATVGAIAYAIFGYIFTALTTWIYNVVAKWTGGVEFTLSEPE